MVCQVVRSVNFAVVIGMTQTVSAKSVRARKRRADLQSALGNRCSQCGAVTALEFDCYPVPESSHHLMDWPRRIAFYWQQHLLGNLRLLCKRCHVRATAILNCKAVPKPLSGFTHGDGI